MFCSLCGVVTRVPRRVVPSVWLTTSAADRVPNSRHIRQSFIDYFAQRGHVYVPSSSVIPLDDPSLLFTNAGMNQFKPIFQGTVDPTSHLAKLERAVNSQKCIRAGGKHNDLEDVGKDVYHHTFFEMLGTWSFGNYYKREAIQYAWELMVNVFGIPKDRFYVTYFGGDETYGIAADEEAKQLWIEAGIPPHRVLPFGMKENFWEMGEVGPCGPCSEIHYDCIGGREAGPLVNRNDPDVLELWNIVFMQYNKESSGTILSLPRKNIDTGMGLERLVSVLQGKRSNYDTDLFVPIFNAVQKFTGTRPYAGGVGGGDPGGVDMAYRVVADHMRTLTVALSDGVMPDNTGRGYVIRRVLRRAVRFGNDKLNMQPGVLANLVPVIAEILGEAFPGFARNHGMIMDIINDEEKLFLKTLSRGRRLFDRTVSRLQTNTIPGDIAWRLYDTYGYPLDLTELMAEERGLGVDKNGYEEAKQHAVELGRVAAEKGDGSASLDVHAIGELRDKGVPLTNDQPKYEYWAEKGRQYTFRPCTSTVVAIRHNKQCVDEATDGQTIGVLLDHTCFYAEQGGQVCDEGFITKHGEEDVQLVVRDVQMGGGYVLHTGVLNGSLKVGDTVNLHLDVDHRLGAMRSHTATHILNFALRRCLGSSDQQGSLVTPDKLRFDFTAKGPMTTEQIKDCEDTVMEVIKASKPIFEKEMSLPVAQKIEGLRAVFGGLYPDPVRVVSVGVPVETVTEDTTGAVENSVELCGGTHVRQTDHIESIAIVSEGAIAKGVRRIVALTGQKAIKSHQYADLLEDRVKELSRVVQSEFEKGTMLYKQANRLIVEQDDEMFAAVISQWRKDHMRNTLKGVKKSLDDSDRARKAAIVRMAVGTAKQLMSSYGANVPEVIVEAVEVGGLSKAIVGAVKEIRESAPSSAAMIFSVDWENGEVLCHSVVPKSLVARGLNADEWVQAVSMVIKGKCGGKALSAEASGPCVEKLQEALCVAREYASLKLS
ncbi:hypothetical protein EMCRGX_G031948 [Ephydatia muelleri]